MMQKQLCKNTIAALTLSTLISPPALGQIHNEDYKLLPDKADYESLGSATALLGKTAAVGATGYRYGADRFGTVYLFDTVSGNQIAQLLPEDGAPNAFFGSSVAINESTIVVGAQPFAFNGGPGYAYLFNANNRQQTAKLEPDDGAALDNFGFSVAISGTIAIIGSYLDDDNGEDSGSAYLFDTTTGQQIAKLLPDDGAAHDWFGFSVAICGSTAIVGSPDDDDDGTDSGSAYLFDVTTGQQISKLLPDDGFRNRRFGASVAIDGTTAAVGPSRGYAAYLFDTVDGLQITKLEQSTERVLGFGAPIAMSDTAIIIGSSRDDTNGGTSGAAYFFNISTGQQTAKILPSDGDREDRFSSSVAIDGSTAIVGAPNNDSVDRNAGSVYVFETIFCSPDLNADGAADFFDVSAFLTAYAENDPTADFNADGIFNFFDVSAFLEAYFAGCP